VHSKVLQNCVQLLRAAERDYVWSAALEMKTALSYTTATLDAQFSGTWTTPGGVEIQKLPVSPLLQGAIAHTLQGVLSLLPQPITPAVRAWAGALYSHAAVSAYLHDKASDTTGEHSLLALNDLTFGPASDLPTTSKTPLFVPPAAVVATDSGKATTAVGDWASQLVSTPGRAVSKDGEEVLSRGVLAILGHLRGAAAVTRGLPDDTDVHQVRLLCGMCFVSCFVS
jgi:hypothetical protein